ncbi:MAG: PAS domain S-box protein [Deltaproteobacteria bacterium]
MNSSKIRNRGDMPQPWQSTLELETIKLASQEQQDQLREERLLNAAILATSSDLILFCNHKGQILRYSRACEQLMSHRWEEDLKGTYIWDSLLSPGDIERAKAFFDRAKSSKGSLILKDQYETDWIDPEGKLHFISWTITLFWDDSGKTSYAICIGTNVTEHHMIEQNLQENKASLRSILENANGIIYTLSPEGRFLFVSRGWTDALGHEISEVKGQSFEIFVHPDYIPVCREFLNATMSTPKPQKPVEYKVKHFDGTWRWHSSSGSAVRDKAGNPRYYVGLAVDITEQKQAEAALRLSEKKFSSAFHSNPDPTTITTLSEGYYVDVNDAWEEQTGFNRREAVGRTGNELGVWVTQEERSCMIEMIREQGALRNYKTRFNTRSGGIRDYIVSAEIFNMGDTRHLLCVHKDVTDTIRAQEALRLSEERFSKAFNASPATMSITIMEDGRYIDVNDSFCSVIGYSRGEILGRTSSEMGFWVDANQRQQVVSALLAKLPVRDVEIVFRRNGGEKRQGSYSAELLEINGQKCLLSIVTDITERKQTEAEIKYLSFYDKLTGLYNRAFFEEEMKRLDTPRELPLSLIMGDVNGLKLVNDALGHHHGDNLLITAAETLKKYCRREDVVARWGGDEFIVLLPGCDYDAAYKVFNRIKKACKRIDTLPFQTSMSLGLACKNHPDQNIREIIKEAEDKMYRNKLLETRSARSRFIMSLEETLWTRSHETREHCQRMQETAEKIGHAVGLPDSEMDNLLLLAALHDIGKIAIPNNILEKTGQLTPDEWETIKKHPEIGYRIGLSSPEMAPIAEAILHHHERWDGKGYPLGLKGVNIPLLSRIVAIADTYDVMVYGRPYQTPASQYEVRTELEKCAGSQFDPELVQIALGILWSDYHGLH